MLSHEMPPKLLFKKWREFFNQVEKSIPSDLNSKWKSIYNRVFSGSIFKEKSIVTLWESQKNISLSIGFRGFFFRTRDVCFNLIVFIRFAKYFFKVCDIFLLSLKFWENDLIYFGKKDCDDSPKFLDVRNNFRAVKVFFTCFRVFFTIFFVFLQFYFVFCNFTDLRLHCKDF